MILKRIPTFFYRRYPSTLSFRKAACKTLNDLILERNRALKEERSVRRLRSLTITLLVPTSFFAFFGWYIPEPFYEAIFHFIPDPKHWYQVAYLFGWFGAAWSFHKWYRYSCEIRIQSPVKLEDVKVTFAVPSFSDMKTGLNSGPPYYPPFAEHHHVPTFFPVSHLENLPLRYMEPCDREDTTLFRSVFPKSDDDAQHIADVNSWMEYLREALSRGGVGCPSACDITTPGPGYAVPRGFKSSIPYPWESNVYYPSAPVKDQLIGSLHIFPSNSSLHRKIPIYQGDFPFAQPRPGSNISDPSAFSINLLEIRLNAQLTTQFKDMITFWSNWGYPAGSPPVRRGFDPVDFFECFKLITKTPDVPEAEYPNSFLENHYIMLQQYEWVVTFMKGVLMFAAMNAIAKGANMSDSPPSDPPPPS